MSDPNDFDLISINIFVHEDGMLDIQVRLTQLAIRLMDAPGNGSLKSRIKALLDEGHEIALSMLQIKNPPEDDQSNGGKL